MLPSKANYTYGHALDQVSNGGLSQFAFGSSTVPQHPYNLRGSYGAADYDVRHSFNANYVWQVPVKAALRGHGSDYLVKGWQISGTIFARSGFPFTQKFSSIEKFLSTVLTLTER
jgi:hypothetical protein